MQSRRFLVSGTNKHRPIEVTLGEPKSLFDAFRSVHDRTSAVVIGGFSASSRRRDGLAISSPGEHPVRVG